MTTRLLIGDAVEQLLLLGDGSVHCVVTSPPYFGLRDYGIDSQIGLEATPEAYVASLVAVFREVWRVLRDDGTLWLNLGDSYATHRNDNDWLKSGATARKGNFVPLGLKAKDLLMIPSRVALALQADGWYLRSEIIWHKPNPMPESVTDRPTSAHEKIFLLSKRERYYYDAEAVKEAASQNSHGGGRTDTLRYYDTAHGGGHNGLRNAKPADETRNLRNVWTVATQPYTEAHFATFPPALIEPCIKAGCPHGGVVLDPFGGAGTTALVADRLGRDAVLIELNPVYAAMAEARVVNDAGLFAEIATDVMLR